MIFRVNVTRWKRAEISKVTFVFQTFIVLEMGRLYATIMSTHRAERQNHGGGRYTRHQAVGMLICTVLACSHIPPIWIDNKYITSTDPRRGC